MRLIDAPRRLVRITSSTWFLALSAILLVVGLGWRTVRPKGEWDESLLGHRLESVQLTDHRERGFELPHPSVIYFYTEECEYCDVAGQRLKRFVAGIEDNSVPVFAITSQGRMPRSAVEALAPTITVVLLSETNGSMNIVQAVPLIVRTDSAGTIIHAWVGVPDDSSLRSLLSR
jgi:thiol-disulfide isomerase/thioredoxin